MDKNVLNWLKIRLRKPWYVRPNPEKKPDTRNAKIKMEIQKKIEKEIISCSIWTKMC